MRLAIVAAMLACLAAPAHADLSFAYQSKVDFLLLALDLREARATDPTERSNIAVLRDRVSSLRLSPLDVHSKTITSAEDDVHRCVRSPRCRYYDERE